MMLYLSKPVHRLRYIVNYPVAALSKNLMAMDCAASLRKWRPLFSAGPDMTIMRDRIVSNKWNFFLPLWPEELHSGRP